MTQHIKTWQDRLGNSAHIKSGGAVGEAMQAEIDELRAALAQPASAPASVSGWKPIESAPTDGTFYLACDNESRWVENFPEGHCAGTWHWSDSRQQWRGHSHDDDREATHWMPLPAAPTGEPG